MTIMMKCQEVSGNISWMSYGSNKVKMIKKGSTTIIEYPPQFMDKFIQKNGQKGDSHMQNIMWRDF